MKSVLEIMEFSVLLYMELLSYVILVRVILSMFASEGKLMQFCTAVSEPIVAPVRSLLDRIPAMENSGIDLSFAVTVMILMILKILLLSVT